EVEVDECAVGLVGADDVIAGGDFGFAYGGVFGGEADFDALLAEVVHHLGGVDAVELRGGDGPGVGGAVLTLLDGALVLEPVVFEVEGFFGRHFVDGDEDGGLLDVGVGAWAPLDGGECGVGAVPLATGDG